MRGDSFVEADDGSTKPIANSACSSQYERVLSAVSRNRRKENERGKRKEKAAADRWRVYEQEIARFAVVFARARFFDVPRWKFEWKNSEDGRENRSNGHVLRLGWIIR